MATPEPADWRTLLVKNSPKLLEQVTAFQNTALADGALSAKTKVLMMLLCDCLLTHHAGATSLAKRARALGASEAEINERKKR